MDIQKIIQVITDVFGAKKQTGDSSALLGQVLTTAREARGNAATRPRPRPHLKPKG